MERILVDEQPDAVAGAVQVPVEMAGSVEDVAARRVDVAGGDALADGPQPSELGLEHEVVDLLLLGGGIADHVAPRHVGVVAVDEGADVDHDGVALDDATRPGCVVRAGGVVRTGGDDRVVARPVGTEATHLVFELVADVDLGRLDRRASVRRRRARRRRCARRGRCARSPRRP